MVQQLLNGKKQSEEKPLVLIHQNLGLSQTVLAQSPALIEVMERSSQQQASTTARALVDAVLAARHSFSGTGGWARMEPQVG